ncbi:C2 domain-containing protein [Fennellomyces sp. T-0311]|nr:C2 domain-containing protein [Fennellomyces sp. T-0311]
MGLPAGTLTVTLIEAKDLKNQDLFGKNDPYVELWLDDDYKQKSSEVKNTNNPVWNETFTFNISKGSSDKKLYLKVLDKDLIGSDKIGDAKVNVKDIINSGRPFDEWVKLPAKLGLSSHGEIRVAIHFTPN